MMKLFFLEEGRANMHISFNKSFFMITLNMMMPFFEVLSFLWSIVFNFFILHGSVLVSMH